MSDQKKPPTKAAEANDTAIKARKTGAWRAAFDTERLGREQQRRATAYARARERL